MIGKRYNAETYETEIIRYEVDENGDIIEESIEKIESE